MTHDETVSVIVRRIGHLGHLQLNRPRAMNALTEEMVRIIGDHLTDWATDDTVHVVLITGSGERGLCAGGDIVAIARDAAAGGHATELFWAAEYPVNALIARYPTPVVTLMDGVVFGGGVGISAHASVRLVTERSKIGMPEAAIGFVPDVGGTYLFSRAPGELGTHLALTSNAMTGSDAITLGLADRFLPSDRIVELVQRLATDNLQQVLAAVTVPAPAPPLLQHRHWINSCYAADTVEEILQRLDSSTEAGAHEAAASIRFNSPTAVKVTLAALRRARALPDLESVLEQEFRVSLHSLDRPDFREGIRAQVIDKDHTPRWSPATLAEVSEAEVDAHFAPLGHRELRLADAAAR
ncbi:enoyl-CoA hydratase/isomerase family protein [Cryobacterium melibiosiphilum]|uniref:3-hydroxyisobutyryl-CoA hydrolase n=1 Tax=Cryobacterium melibiosiphilum TaxID=995039 RepID=A0A3A5MM98_9MICO|nr:enoyl-CoA hydratase/isomerase family protein [Cryobacterium melibiosiphilum]RJT90125.1 enoyl-CoA hydratase/isomerase family protein [Cryobacterium melibiosiphilum]